FLLYITLISRSTLFPYTTLFRSKNLLRAFLCIKIFSKNINMSSIDKYLVQALDNYPYNLEDALTSLEYALSYDENNTQALCLYGDRKSTRLNSSHVKISYAVFCL